MVTLSVRLALLAAFAVAPFCRPANGQQPVAPDAGCVQHKGAYVCNWSSFKLAFDRAKTVAIQTDRLDRSTGRQLDQLISTLGKTRLPEGHTADLTMLLIPVEPTGVSYGNGDHDLATLRIYAPSESSARGTLLWAETLRGPGDRPWPAQVQALIEQFQNRFGKQ